MKVLAFGASNSSTSINKQLAAYTGSLLTTLHNDVDLEVIDLNDFELPLFSTDKEKSLGQPALAKDFFNKIGESDALIISYAEHNGSYTAAYKNIFDWASRIDQKVFQGKPMVLLATSPGPGGAKNVLAIATDAAPHFNGDVKASVSVPSFYANYDSDKEEFNNKEIEQQLLSAIKTLL